MDNPLTKLALGTKLGPLTRGHWLLLGGGVTGVAYWRHRRHMADVAGATDPTVAGATQDANGNQVLTDGTATDAGTTPMSMFDPYTSGYSGYGYDLALGAGGIVGMAPVGIDGTRAGPVLAPATSQNPATPGATTPAINVSYPSVTRVRNVESPSKTKRDTVHRRVHRSSHNVKNGRQPHHRNQTHKHDPSLKHHHGWW